MPALGDENIGGLDVAVNDAFAVGGIKRLGNLNGYFEDGLNFHGAAGDAMFECLAVEKFHDDIGFAIFFADIVNRADVGMIERAGGFGFALEALERLRVVRHIIRQKFQRNGAIQARVLSLVHHAHAAATEFFDDAIVRDCAADHGL